MNAPHVVEMIRFLTLCLFAIGAIFRVSAQLPALIPYHIDTSWGYCDSTGVLQLPAVYDGATFFYGNHAVVKKDSLWGAVDLFGKEVLPFEFQHIKPSINDTFVVRKQGKWGMITSSGEVLLPFHYDGAHAFHNGFAVVYKNGYYGYVNTFGMQVTPLQFDEATHVMNGYAAVRLNDKWGLINTEGNGVLPFVNSSIQLSSDSIVLECNQQTTRLLWTELNLLYDFSVVLPLNNNSYIVGQLTSSLERLRFGVLAGDSIRIPMVYDKISPPKEGWFRVEKNGMYGFVDTLGSKEPRFNYYYAEDYSHGLALTKLKKGFGYIDNKGKKAIPHRFGQARSFSNGWAAVTADRNGWSGWHYIDTEGNVLNEEEYIAAGPMENGCAIVCLFDVKNGNKCWGAINGSGEYVIEPKYAGLWSSENGGFIVADFKNRLAVLDSTGKRIVKAKYTHWEPQSNDQVIVQYKKRFGILKADYSVMQSCEYWEITKAGPHYAIRTEKGFGLMDETGKVRLIPELQTLTWQPNEEVFVAQRDSLYGVVSSEGEWILEPQFSTLQPFENGLARVEFRPNIWGYIDRYGRLYFEE